MNTYTRDHNKREAEHYDIATDTRTSDSMILSDVELRKVELGEERQSLVDYLNAKVRAKDWHAVQDAASDIREIEAKIDELSRT